MGQIGTQRLLPGAAQDPVRLLKTEALSSSKAAGRVAGWSVSVKVAIAPVTAIACLILVGALGIWGSLVLLHSMQDMRIKTLPSLASMSELQRRLATVVATTNQSLAWTGAAMPADRVKLVDKEASAELQAIGRQIAEEAGRDIYGKEVRAQLQKLAGAYKNFQMIAMELLDLKQDGLALAAPFMQQLLESYKRVDQQIVALSETLRKVSDAHVGDASGDAEAKMQAIAATSLLALVLCGAVAWWGARSIVRPLKEATVLASEIASGNIVVRQRAAASDETGRMLEALLGVAANLNRMVGDIRRAASEIDVAAGEIAGGNAELSARTDRNAAALQGATQSIDHLASMVRESADRAREVNASAQAASQVAELGGTMVEDLVGTMQGLNAQATRIGEIIGTIDGIAFQTNLLALNAAVEAARAGEQGRGFAVVAKEVRSLAASSGEAARQIRSLISSSVTTMGAGAHRAQEAGQTVKRVVLSVKEVAHTIGAMARAAEEQAIAIARFSETVTEMDRSTQENAALVEQAGAATLLLRRQSEQLATSIRRFQVE